MQRSLKITEDGSHTLLEEELGEAYHSLHGALQESMHVFIKQGLLTLNKASIKILELGFGTGLNALLSLREAHRQKLDIHYHTVEKYPLIESEYNLLNYETLIEGLPEGILHKIHSCPWQEPVRISRHFTLYKDEADFRSMIIPSQINLVYFDAFSPDKQPELWSSEVFNAISQAADKGTILVTYSAKGAVRRKLDSCGFAVSKLAGPPGKREMIRATKR